MSDVTAEVKGVPELKAAFRKLGPDLAASILTKALQAGANVLKDAIAERATEHHKTGEMEASLMTAVDVSPSGMSGVARVGFGEQGHKAAWVELGHRQVGHGIVKSERKEVGHVPAHPFVRPAYEASKGAAKDAVAEVIRERMKGK